MGLFGKHIYISEAVRLDQFESELPRPSGAGGQDGFYYFHPFVQQEVN
jgi:hypothetical protein